MTLGGVSADAPRKETMNNFSRATAFAARLINNGSFRKGAAAGIAGLVVAIVEEALWPPS